ncbi:MAG: hypothetical protein JRF61_07325 [Deltaproteobacteria bacterium]|jgi:small ligand-binding sensory domain FIST|nr:hypothetical protein [Deltaproteobacteria bacterium]
MQRFTIGSTRAMAPEQAALELAECVEKELGAETAPAGGMLWSTAAAGTQGAAVGRLLAERWPAAELVGTSFEGVLVDGRLDRDRPAMVLLAWAAAEGAPTVFAFEAGECDVERMVHDLLEGVGRSELGPRDLLLLFPDAHGSAPVESLLCDFAPRLGRPCMVGAAAAGLEGEAALAWVGQESWPGALVGLIVPASDASEPAPAVPRVFGAGATRLASDWLRVTRSRGHWLDRLEEESALVWARRQLGLAEDASVEPHLDRLLLRLCRGAREDEAAPGDRVDFDERYVVGIDADRGALCLPTSVKPGDEVAFALPDAALAREALAGAVEALPRTPCLLHLKCRARDASLHGDAELEPALVAHLARDRRTAGTVSPFQIAPAPDGGARLRVHTSLLVALGDEQ